jgi:hypothetical protein
MPAPAPTAHTNTAAHASAGACARYARLRGGLACPAVNGPHFPDHLRHLIGADDVLVRPQVANALVGNGLLEIREDLRLVGIAGEPLLRHLQVGPQSVVTDGVELIRIAVQTDGDHGAHDYCPSPCGP